VRPWPIPHNSITTVWVTCWPTDCSRSRDSSAGTPGIRTRWTSTGPTFSGRAGPDNAYFMGTVVLASDGTTDNRQLIIDGQQRIITTAILFIAIRDRLKELDQPRAAQSVEDNHLSDYILTEVRPE